MSPEGNWLKGLLSLDPALKFTTLSHGGVKADVAMISTISFRKIEIMGGEESPQVGQGLGDHRHGLAV